MVTKKIRVNSQEAPGGAVVHEDTGLWGGSLPGDTAAGLVGVLMDPIGSVHGTELFS